MCFSLLLPNAVPLTLLNLTSVPVSVQGPYTNTEVKAAISVSFHCSEHCLCAWK